MDIFKQKIINFSKRPVLLFIFSLTYFILSSVYITYPLIFRMSDLAAEKVDELYISWIINWDIYSFTHNIFNIFNANIFYPYHNTLAYSETFITSAIISFLPVKIFREPLVAYNFNFIFALVTFGFFTYLLTQYLTKSHFSSVVSGTLVSFSAYTLSKYMHLQLLSIGWVPLSLLFFIKFLDCKRYKYLIASVIVFVIQLYNSILPGYFIVFSCFVILVYYFFKRKITLKSINLYKFLFIIIIGLIAIFPVIFSYYQVSKEFNYERDIRDSIRFANRPEYTLYPGNTTRLDGFLLNTVYKSDKGSITYDGFVGAAFFVLSAIAILYRIRNKNKKFLMFDIFITIGVIGFILSLGPFFQWGGHVIKHPFVIPLPYAIFYYLVPGFNGLRNSARWEMLFLFSFSIGIGIFLSVFFKNRSNLFKVFIAVVICSAVLLEFKFPYNYYLIPTKEKFPKVYNYVKNLPKDSVISEFPIYNWGTFADLNSENLREYYSTLSFRSTFNGGAGFNPPPWQIKATYLIKYFPNEESIRLLKKNGVNYIVLHSWEYNLIHNKNYDVDGKIVLSGDKVKEILDGIKSVELVYSINNDYVYKIK